MTVRWNATWAMRHLDSDPTAGTAEAYGEMPAKCPMSRVEVDGSKVDRWAALSHAELPTVLRGFRRMGSTVTTERDGTPVIIPLFADPPLHTGFRELLNANFPPEVVGRLEAGIRQIAVEMVDAMVTAGEVDFAESFSYPYPTRVLCLSLGIPESDWPVHHEFVMTIDKLSNSNLSDPESAMFEEPFPARTSSFSLNGDVVRRSYPVLSVNEMPLRMNAAAPSEAA
ncbi:cytochrome P450 family protein [Streptomyces spongiae]|uniref:Cytochrome P450 n=1 Tax=Streptomyces spongiae TaxID=565072 RepID=A0A5N8X8B7_9ACTN|nr:hypothetical protein [Streptomyces spongiae]MPY55720.1 hypothetical protein [Streptomyces spongiae]